MRYSLFVLLLLAPLARVVAQSPGACALGVAGADLSPDGSEVYARVFNTGSLFFGNGTTNGKGYLVPKDTFLSPLFAAGLWVGGRVNGELRVAASQYARFEYWPGPLNEGATLPNPADCSAYDRIFVVSRADVRRYLETGEDTNDLRDWPVDWGAPVLDGDGIDGNYDLEGGDQPAIYGEQTAWWVMNDVGNVHEETGSNPLGIEVQVSAFGVGQGILPLRQATWYRYRILNRSPHPIDSMFVSMFSDPDLGDATDDWVGSDTTLGLGYVYNGDSFDDPSNNGYGVPPAHGRVLVQGPVGLPNSRDDDRDGEVDEEGEQFDLTAVTYWCNGCPQPATVNPRTKEEYYWHMRGRWKNGIPFTESGDGYQDGGAPTVFVFPGDPVTGQCWSMANDCTGGSVNPNNQYLVAHTGPFRLGPGEETEIVFGLPFAQGRDQFDSVTQLRYAAHAVKAAWDLGVLAPSRVEAEQIPNLPSAIEITSPAPNPFTDRLSLSYTLPEALAVRVTVLDVLGREVAVLASGPQSAGPHAVAWEAADLPAGTYLVRIEAAGEERAFPVTKRR